jgi:hypothetical protein
MGHHWANRREAGEPQLTFNYVRAMSDWMNSFTFSKGVQFQTPHATEHIVPSLLKEVWEQQNNKEQLLWEIGQQGGVAGDVFIKVAWEPEWADSSGLNHPGRVRIIPLNAAFCFPEWHPHDRSRLLRFKLKYRFWGTTMEGTRSVFTYTEIFTDDVIEEYVNDELLDQRPNPLGLIPVVHIANALVSSSPWGKSDIADILSINREYNEKATDISDIINYHAAPVTIITGAKVSNLEKGAKKVWAGLPEKAQVYNLENAVNLEGPMGFLNMLKIAMHEMTGVPETALGQAQPISNTSGVALAIQYQPAMIKYSPKKIQYSVGFNKVNEFVLRTLFTFDPARLVYDPSTQGMMEQDGSQADILDPNDPLIYQSDCHWPVPLPVDKLIKLNELMLLMQLGLESNRGALKDLGEEFPDEKLYEIFEEKQEDAKQAGALKLIDAHITAAIMELTGINPNTGEEPPPPPANSADGSATNTTPPQNNVILPGGVSANQLLGLEDVKKITNEIVTMAYGPRLASRRSPDETNS